MRNDNSISERVDGLPPQVAVHSNEPPRTYLLGILILFAVVLLWVASNFVTQVSASSRMPMYKIGH